MPATGRLLSEPFELVGDLLVFRIGGGQSPDGLYVALIVDQVRVRTATGRDSETLGRKVWDIASFRKRQGRIEIYDGETGPHDHITADEFAQWTSSSKKPIAAQ